MERRQIRPLWRPGDVALTPVLLLRLFPLAAILQLGVFAYNRAGPTDECVVRLKNDRAERLVT